MKHVVEGDTLLLNSGGTVRWIGVDTPETKHPEKPVGELGRHKEAIKAYEQAIRIKPDFAEAHYNLGEAYFKLKKRRMSIEQYKILKNLDSELANNLSNLIYK